MFNILIASAMLFTAVPVTAPSEPMITQKFLEEKQEDIYQIKIDKFEELKIEVVARLKEEARISAEATKLKEERARLARFKPKPIQEIKLAPTYVPVCAPQTNVVTWMDYRANKIESAPQTKIQRTGNVVTASDGTRYTNGYLHVAMARQYGNIGDQMIINFEGTDVPVVLVEWKGNTSCQHPDGSMIELVIDSTVGTNVSAYQRKASSIRKVK